MRTISVGLLFALTISAQSARSGLDVGVKAPSFSLQDQNGKLQTFDTVKGQNGAVLVFFRSADW